MGKSVVSIVKGTDADKMVEEALSLLGGVDSLIKPNSVVVIKPNAGHPFAPETSICTSPAVVAATIKAVRKANPKEIIVAEAAAVGCDTMQCFEISGIGKAAEDAGADRIIDIKSEKDLIKVPIRDARSDLTSVLLPKFLIEADHLVNLPIFKAHVSVVYTCALKNMKGVVQDKVHYQMHQTDLAQAMVDLWSVCKADLSIADVIRPAEGFAPHTGLPVDFGCVVAGKDPAAVDATICRMVGLDFEKVDYCTPVRERNFGNWKEKNIEIRGKSVEEVFKYLWFPYLGGFDQWPEYDIHGEGACSSCQSLLACTMEKLKSLGEYDKNAGMTIVVGRTKELPKGVDPNNLLLFGDCTKKFRDQGIFSGGCPPLESSPLWSIMDRKSYTTVEDRGFDGRARQAKEGPLFLEYMKKKRAEVDKENKVKGK
ncbi:DUF362 domain-containing protein [Chloroflexota bacterium]